MSSTAGVQTAGQAQPSIPLDQEPIGQDQKAAALVEEGRAHITVSLLIGVSGSGLFS